MKFGAIFPQLEIGNDPAAIRDMAQAVEAMGYDHLLAYEHVVGADPDAHPGWKGVYDYRSAFHEPFALFPYIAALTRRIELVTCIVILPQRQTVLVAKQAAELDILSGERFRLGVGVGWNPVEFVALGQDFHTRGRRCEEQVRLIRELWTNDVVTFRGRWDTIVGAGINPRPNRAIPIWFGGTDDRALKRAAELGDGWFPLVQPDEAGLAKLKRLRSYAREAGRDPMALGVEARIQFGGTTPDQRRALVEAWRAAGATHISINTMNAGLASPDQHIAAQRQFYEECQVHR